MFLRRLSGKDQMGEVALHPTATIDIKGPTIAYHLKKLGLRPGATWEQIGEAYRSLMSDLTPGPDAQHSNVELAEELRDEVDRAYRSLMRFRPGGSPAGSRKHTG